MSFFNSGPCKHELVCVACRSLDPAFRQKVAQRWRIESVDYECPKGHEIGAAAEQLQAFRQARQLERVQLTVQSQTLIQLSDVEAKAKPKAKHSTAIPPAAMPRDQWPMAVRILARLASDGEKGVGDTIKNQLKIGNKDVIDWAMKAMKIPCGCDDRRIWLNARFPYPAPA